MKNLIPASWKRRINPTELAHTQDVIANTPVDLLR